VTQYEAHLAQLFPAASRAQIVDAFVTRERRATFRQAAGSWARRPGPATGLAGIWLAGAWTDTGWPDTMESAVRSGIAAADAALGSTDDADKRAAMGAAVNAATRAGAEDASGASRSTRTGVVRG
jgi:uncharacterized protein with NAD-binding domain and iron-sulfur cluster